MSEQPRGHLAEALKNQQPVAKPTKNPEAEQAMAKLIARHYPGGARPETAPEPKIPSPAEATTESHRIARDVYEQALARDEKRLRQEIFDKTPLGKLVNAGKDTVRKIRGRKEDPKQEKPE